MKHPLILLFISICLWACTGSPPPTDKYGFLLDREKAEFKGILLGKEVTITESDSTINNVAGKFADGNQLENSFQGQKSI